MKKRGQRFCPPPERFVPLLPAFFTVLARVSGVFGDGYLLSILCLGLSLLFSPSCMGLSLHHSFISGFLRRCVVGTWLFSSKWTYPPFGGMGMVQ